jgi:hypothetical protein
MATIQWLAPLGGSARPTVVRALLPARSSGCQRAANGEDAGPSEDADTDEKSSGDALAPPAGGADAQRSSCGRSALCAAARCRRRRTGSQRYRCARGGDARCGHAQREAGREAGPLAAGRGACAKQAAPSAPCAGCCARAPMGTNSRPKTGPCPARQTGDRPAASQRNRCCARAWLPARAACGVRLRRSAKASLAPIRSPSAAATAAPIAAVASCMHARRRQARVQRARTRAPARAGPPPPARCRESARAAARSRAARAPPHAPSRRTRPPPRANYRPRASGRYTPPACADARRACERKLLTPPTSTHPRPLLTPPTSSGDARIHDSAALRPEGSGARTHRCSRAALARASDSLGCTAEPSDEADGAAELDSASPACMQPGCGTRSRECARPRLRACVHDRAMRRRRPLPVAGACLRRARDRSAHTGLAVPRHGRAGHIAPELVRHQHDARLRACVPEESVRVCMRVRMGQPCRAGWAMREPVGSPL